MAADMDHEMVEEMGKQLETLLDENERLTKLICSDTQLADLLGTVKTQSAQIDILRERNAGLMEEKNLAIKEAQALRRLNAKLKAK